MAALAWPDLPETGPIRVYTVEEIAAERLRCVMQRMQCGDLLDLWHLFEDARVDPSDAAEMFWPKAKHRGLKPEGFQASYRIKLAQYRRHWTTELADHLTGDCRTRKRSSEPSPAGFGRRSCFRSMSGPAQS